MKSLLRVLLLSILIAVIIIITLVSIVQLNLPVAVLYIIYGITAVAVPMAFLLLYFRIWGSETLYSVPVGFILAALYSLGVALYSYYGKSSFSDMFGELMYFIYFLPSVIYCGMSWVIFAIILRITKKSRRREL